MTISPDGGFELPADMLEAAPHDVQGVLDALDTVLIEGARDDNDHTLFHSTELPEELAEGDVFQVILTNMAQRMRLTPEQLSKKLSDGRLQDLEPVEGMERFMVRRFHEGVTLGIIVRTYSDSSIRAAHIHDTTAGLKLWFDYDVPGGHRSTVADCEELKRQLGRSFAI